MLPYWIFGGNHLDIAVVGTLIVGVILSITMAFLAPAEKPTKKEIVHGCLIIMGICATYFFFGIFAFAITGITLGLILMFILWLVFRYYVLGIK